jgi:hypothetical protein
MCNHSKDDLAAFNPREMLRSYNNAKPVFTMLGVADNIAYDTFDLAHGYWPEDRETMLGWFNLHLKGIGNGSPVKEIPFRTLPMDKLMVFGQGKRDPRVVTTGAYCKQKGNELRASFLRAASFDTSAKRNDLKRILKVNEEPVLRKAHEYEQVNGWRRFALETDKLIPVLLHEPKENSTEFMIVADVTGKENISVHWIDSLIKKGCGVAIVDLSGTGETSSNALCSNDSVGRLRTLTKSCLWLGKTVMGEWVKELSVVSQFIHAKYPGAKAGVTGNKEAGLAGLYLAAMDPKIETVTLRDAPVSYLFDDRNRVEYFSTAIHVPGILTWGDVSLAVALSGKNITFINPVTMSGQKITGDKLNEFKAEFEHLRKACGTGGNTILN